MFAKNLVTAPFLGVFSYATQVCKKFGNFTPILGVFSYATQVKVCKKFGDFTPLLGVFSYATQVKVCKKFGNFTPFLGVFSYATQVTVSKKFGDCLLHFREVFLCYTEKSLQKNWGLFCSILGSFFFLCCTG